MNRLDGVMGTGVVGLLAVLCFEGWCMAHVVGWV